MNNGVVGMSYGSGSQGGTQKQVPLRINLRKMTLMRQHLTEHMVKQQFVVIRSLLATSSH